MIVRIALVLFALTLTACPSVGVRTDDPAAFDDGVNAFMRGDYASAAHRLQSYLDRNPTGAKAHEAHYWLGLCHMMTGKPREAVAHLAKAEKVAREPWLYNMGVATMRCGDLNGGREFLLQLVRQYPNGEEARKAKEKLTLTEKGYMVQMGYYSRKANAEQETSRGRALGLSCAVKEVATPSGAGYFVVAGPFPTWEETVRQSDRIKQLGIQSIPLP